MYCEEDPKAHIVTPTIFFWSKQVTKLVYIQEIGKYHPLIDEKNHKLYHKGTDEYRLQPPFQTVLTCPLLIIIHILPIRKSASSPFYDTRIPWLMALGSTSMTLWPYWVPMHPKLLWNELSIPHTPNLKHHDQANHATLSFRNKRNGRHVAFKCP